ncbi:Tannase/feruloyl esterase [Cadophora sp. MPI-SDFR-AT-0126]|nr:Tannase/feruloyl esterase [Leotiomycetes sp. MPI-SDFR-AT-0126]
MLAYFLLLFLAVGQRLAILPATRALELSSHESRKVSCASLAQSLKLTNTTIISATALAANAAQAITGGQTACGAASFMPSVNICRVVANISTSSQSTTLSEIWLPDSNLWTGRLLATGGGGLGGCIDYGGMAYTTAMGFAVTGTNGGHDGYSGASFGLNNDIILDFSYRSLHVTVGFGEAVVKAFYNNARKYSYYFGCSTGGRQGLKAAQMFPNDYDGIIAGAPATDFNHLASWGGHFYPITGPNETDPRFVSATKWLAIHQEVLKQCDAELDGVADGILEDPSRCFFNPDPLVCSSTNANTSTCLTDLQAETVRKVYSPLYGEDGALVYPRFTPSAELSALSGPFGYLGGSLTTPATDWYKYAIYDDPAFPMETLNAADYKKADDLDAFHGYVSSYSGDLLRFKKSGGKIITYHGFSDSIIAPEQSMRYYKHVIQAMGQEHHQLDSFYRLFRISGMDHCSGGRGAWAFGQSANVINGTSNVVNDIVKWVEQGTAPDTIVGTKYVNDSPALGIDFQRGHCRYPYLTSYKGGNPSAASSWGCNLLPGW